MKGKVETKSIKQKQVNQVLRVNGGALDVNYEILVDGKLVLKEKGHSLTQNFAELLVGMLAGYSPARYRHVNINSSFTRRNITSFSDYGDGTLKITADAGSNFDSSLTYVVCHGTGYAALDDIQVAATYINTVNCRIPSINYSDAVDADATMDAIKYYTTSGMQGNYGAQINVGLGDTAVAIEDVWLSDDANGMTRGTSTISTNTGTMPSSTRLSRVFTNNTGGSVTIKEVGAYRTLYYTGSTAYGGYISRDVLSSPISVPDQSNVTINYDIAVALATGTDAGGWLLNFANALNSVLGAVSRTLTATDGEGYSTAVGDVGAPVASLGANNVFDNTDAVKQSVYGILVGTGSTATVGSEYDLGTRIVQGDTAGTLWHYGTTVDGYTVGADYAEFEIARLFENRSGGAITVSEVGFSGRAGGNGLHSALLARNVLTTPVAVDDGEALKVSYTIRIEV